MLLTDFQHPFTAYVLRGEDLGMLSAYVKDNGISAAQLLSVYRNNTQLGLTEALREGYPVVNKLIGNDCFNQFARDFIRQHSPTAGCLLAFGKQLPEFIAGYPTLATLPYLADVARLEWYWHEAFHEADAKALSIQDLTKIDSAQYPDLSLQLQLSARLLASAYPVLDIWLSNQDGYAGNGLIELNQGGNRILINRPDLDVLMYRLAESEYQFLLALQQALPLAEAATNALNVDNTFDILAVLQRWFARGLFTGYSTTNNH
jgi:hypothetical protein